MSIVEHREEIVTNIQRAASSLLLDQEPLSVELKSNHTYVTELDVLIQQNLKLFLMREYPDWKIVGEEDFDNGFEQYKLRHPHEDYILIDPIDGTAPFIRGLTGIPGVNVAFIRADDRPELAIFWQPGRKRTYVATSSTFWINGKEHSKPVVPPQKPLGACYLYTSSDVHRSLDLSRWEGKLRALGSSGCHLAMLLDGTTDPIGVLLTRYKKWDVTGLFHAETAGCLIRDLKTREFHTFQTICDDQPILVAPPQYVDKIMDQVSVRPSM